VPLGGIIWSMIICIPFWVVVIFLIKAGAIAMETLMFVGLILSVSGLLLFLILRTPQNLKKPEQSKKLISLSAEVRATYMAVNELIMVDNGGSRLGIDRRNFEYSAYIPERRSGRDRRKGFDRRNSIVLRRESERRNVFKTQSLN